MVVARSRIVWSYNGTTSCGILSIGGFGGVNMYKKPGVTFTDWRKNGIILFGLGGLVLNRSCMADREIRMRDAETKHMKHRLSVLAPLGADRKRRRSLEDTVVIGSDEKSCGRVSSVILTVSWPMETL